MFDFGFIELVIALLTTYLALGLVTSYVNDLVASLLRWRSETMVTGIRRLLGNPVLAQNVLDHPLVSTIDHQEGQAPRFIPAEIFASALLDVVAGPGDKTITWQALRLAVEKLPDCTAKSVLLEFLQEFPDDLAGIRRAIGEWFMREMDYAASLFSRRVKLLSLFVAIVLTFSLGIDTFAIATFFLQKSAIDSTIAAAAAVYTQNPTEENLQHISAIAQSSLPIGWGTLPETFLDWVRKFVGLGISALAVALAAPFSYNVRSQLLPRLFYPPANVTTPLENIRKAQPGQVQEIAASQILLLNEYQNQVLSEQNRSFLYALVAAALGLGFFLTAITFLLLQQKSDAALVSALAGAIVEVISGINFYLYSQTSAQVALFHARLDMTQRFLLANSVCESLKDDTNKDNARSDLVHAIATLEPIASKFVKEDDNKKRDGAGNK